MSGTYITSLYTPHYLSQCCYRIGIAISRELRLGNDHQQARVRHPTSARARIAFAEASQGESVPRL